MNIPPPWRKALLTAHVVTAVGWLGTDAALLTMAVAGLAGADPAVVYPAIGLVGSALLVPLSVLTWLVGVLTGLLTRWGLVTHRWVAVKLLVTTVLTGLVLVALPPSLREAAALGAATPPEIRLQLVFATSVSLAALVALSTLSTYKPGGRLRRRPGAGAAAEPSRSPVTGRTGPSGGATSPAASTGRTR